MLVITILLLINFLTRLKPGSEIRGEPASEIKPILSVLETPPGIDKQVLYNYLCYGRVNYSNATFFDGILSPTGLVLGENGGFEDCLYIFPYLLSNKIRSFDVPSIILL